MGGVDADELDAAAQIDLDQLPAVRQLSLRVGGFRQPYPRPRGVEADHRARVCAVHCYRLAGRESDIGEKALVAPDQDCRNKRRGKTHSADCAHVHATKLPPRSSSIWIRTISSNELSATNPSSRARRASMRCGQLSTMRLTSGSAARRMRAATCSPAIRRSAAICSPTV